MLLAIDTGTTAGGVALAEDGRVLVSRLFDVGLQHARLLMDEVDAALALAGRAPGDLKAVGVAIGPGSYTGLRIGLAAAKGICLGAEAALVAVPSLECQAARLPFCALPVCAVAVSRRGEVYAASFDTAGGVPRSVGAVEIDAPEEVVRRRRGQPTVYIGDAVAAYPEVFAADEDVRPLADIPPSDPARLALLATARLERGETSDLDATEPLYLKLPDYLKRNAGR